MLLIHASNDTKVTEILNSYEIKGCDSYFDGLFCEGGTVSNRTGEFKTVFEVADNTIADNGDHDLDYDKTMAFLSTEYSDLSEDELDTLYNYTAGDEECDEDDLPLLESNETWEMAFIYQNIRGMIAKDQKFNAIAMSDEFGTSYFIPVDSEYKVVR